MGGSPGFHRGSRNYRSANQGRQFDSKSSLPLLISNQVILRWHTFEDDRIEHETNSFSSRAKSDEAAMLSIVPSLTRSKFVVSTEPPLVRSESGGMNQTDMGRYRLGQVAHTDGRNRRTDNIETGCKDGFIGPARIRCEKPNHWFSRRRCPSVIIYHPWSTVCDHGELERWLGCDGPNG